MKQIKFSQHAEDQLSDRGATKAEARESIQNGETVPAKRGRLAFRKNFPHNAEWNRKHYATKQVMPIVVEEENTLVVITVYVFYFGGKE